MPSVELTLGSVKGVARSDHEVYLGIPFAQPPTGQGRFRPPRPVEPWQGERSAEQFAAACPQGQHPIPGMAASGPRDEDCLYLNVFTPRADSEKRPVLVWIHGGGFMLGSGSELLYDGGRLAQRGDVVVVSIHYRLAALGYACLGEAGRLWGASANLGQLDQIEALRWVREHIGQFGGDADNVTVFGESAGSAAVGTLLAMPAAAGLFHKAIMQSGVGSAQGFETASRFGESLLARLAVESGDETAVIGLDADAIVSAAIDLSEATGFRLGPVVDGVTLLKTPMQANAEGSSADIPLLIGTNRDEQKLFNVSSARPDLNDGELCSTVAEFMDVPASRAAEVVASFKRSRLEAGLPCQNVDILDAIQTVVRFREPTDRFAAEHAQHQPKTYQYLFTYPSPARGGSLGSCHALEMPFVFGTLDAPTQDRFAGTGETVQTLSMHMMDAWIAFARSGNPNHPGLALWPAFDGSTRSTMIFDRRCEVVNDPFSDERQVIQTDG